MKDLVSCRLEETPRTALYAHADTFFIIMIIIPLQLFFNPQYKNEPRRFHGPKDRNHQIKK